MASTARKDSNLHFMNFQWQFYIIFNSFFESRSWLFVEQFPSLKNAIEIHVNYDSKAQKKCEKNGKLLAGWINLKKKVFSLQKRKIQSIVFYLRAEIDWCWKKVRYLKVSARREEMMINGWWYMVGTTVSRSKDLCRLLDRCIVMLNGWPAGSRCDV